MQLILWDFNGTIIDDAAYCHDIETQMLEERHMPTFTLKQYRDMFCFPVIDYYGRMGYTFENETYDAVAEEFNQAYDKNFLSLKLMDGFLDLIHTSLDKGYENVILSASREDKLKEQCHLLGIDQYFTELLGTDNLYGGSKVNIGKAFMQKRKFDPKECMFIGDSLHDKETANAIGIENVVLVARGHQSKKVLEKGCDHVVNSFAEVVL